MTATKRFRGKVAYHAGLVAEDIVSEQYKRAGYPTVARRWRGSCGEIDLIAQDGDGVIFIEVKKSRSHARAAQRVTLRQLERIYGAGSEFLATQPKGQLTNVRVDVALVDETGRIDIIENVSMAA